MNKLHTYIAESEKITKHWEEMIILLSDKNSNKTASGLEITYDPNALITQIKKIVKEENKAILERVVEMIEEHQKTTFNIEKIGEITLDRPVVYCEDLKAQLTESEYDN